MSQDSIAPEIEEKLKSAIQWIPTLREEIARVIVGQHYLVDRLLVGLLANGHVLLEGVPGLAKTLSIRTLASATAADFKRIQFTPDLLPADILGTLIYSPKENAFHTRKGPIFANLILADEINRAPAKVQSALLEAMQEHQVSIGGTSEGSIGCTASAGNAKRPTLMYEIAAFATSCAPCCSNASTVAKSCARVGSRALRPRSSYVRRPSAESVAAIM